MKTLLLTTAAFLLVSFAAHAASDQAVRQMALSLQDNQTVFLDAGDVLLPSADTGFISQDGIAPVASGTNELSVSALTAGTANEEATYIDPPCACGANLEYSDLPVMLGPPGTAIAE